MSLRKEEGAKRKPGVSGYAHAGDAGGGGVVRFVYARVVASFRLAPVAPPILNTPDLQ